jgi:signal peptidase II|tara:strand:+ start:714 stop:1202 length:489 start_codon:yes stop_codon:yes gene_type:complete
MEKKNIITNKNVISLFIIFLAFLFDRISKIKVINHQEKNNSIYINDYLNFDLTWNSGIGFGLLNFEANFIYHLISLVILSVILMVFYLLITSVKFEKYLYSLILGGALGNFYDRVIYYSVPDFIDFHIENYHWFTFNIADIFITTGIILIIFNQLITKNEKI